MNDLTTLFLKVPRGSEINPESAQTFLAALTQINSVGRWDRLMGARPQVLSLEIMLFKQQIHFCITCDIDLAPFVEAQLQSNYPLVIIENGPDPLLTAGALHVQELSPKKGIYYPIATYPAFQEVDPISSILSVLSKAPPESFAAVQISLEAISGTWQSNGQKMIDKGIVDKEGNRSSLPDEAIIREKISFPGFGSAIRVAASDTNTLNGLISAFGVFNKSDGNSLGRRKAPLFGKVPSYQELLSRTVSGGSILNIHEIATLWHLPGEKVKIASIVWGHSVLSEAPDNLPAAMDMSDDEKNQANFFAKTMYKNTEAVFGIKDKDRRRHVWVIGKTGTGKSTLIENMVIDDLKKGRGVALIDPHGDACETVLNYIPKNRINETIYFNPSDRDFPVVINPLEVTTKEEAELVVSGLMSIFTKIWANVWSARMEYILRNSLMTLTEIEEATLADVLRLLAEPDYRNHVLQRINDEALKQYWLTEYNKMPDRLQKEAIAPIQNKVGQFVTSPMIRRIIGHPKSSVSLRHAMDNKMIFLANLSQGRLGEDNSALLGATLITKFQLAAMHRVDMLEEDRKDFHLFVDEFQNFATTSFIKILSEARKYRLNLMLANQYMAQIPDEVTKAILGNVGTLVSFGLGADDAQVVHKEYAEVFSQNDLVNLDNFQIAVKLMIDGHSSRPFLAHTLPLPASKNENRETVLDISRQRWSRRIEELEKERAERMEKTKTKPKPQQQNQDQKPKSENKPKPHNKPKQDNKKWHIPKPRTTGEKKEDENKDNKEKVLYSSDNN